MSNERVQFNLTERFAAPLPEFYRRRIIFWKDEDREFEKDVDELDLEGVKIIKLTGTNNFAVKKLLLHDDLESDYLVYCPITYTSDEDNWLQDIEYYSETFRADFISMQMDELNIAPSAAMRKTVKLYAKFFDSKERIQKLRRIGRDYQTPLQLHIDIMAVLAGLSEGSAQDVIIAVLAAGLDKETNSVLQNIRKFGSIEAFWQLARKYTGYIEEEDKPLGCFAAHVLLTALSQTMNASVLKGLERFVSETNKAYCYSIVHEWRSREDNEDLYELCRTVENELQLPTRFDKFEPETLITGDGGGGGLFVCRCDFLGGRDSLGNRREVQTGRHLTHNAFINVEQTLQLAGELRRALEGCHDIVALGLVVDGVCQTALAPLCHLDNRLGVGVDDANELFDCCLDCLVAVCDIHDEQALIILVDLLHVKPPYGLKDRAASDFPRSKETVAYRRPYRDCIIPRFF